MSLVAFRLYDLDGNGVISREEMSQVIESYYKLVGPLISSSGKKYETPEQLVDEFFEQMDQNGDGVISLEEYKEGAMKNPDIIQVSCSIYCVSLSVVLIGDRIVASQAVHRSVNRLPHPSRVVAYCLCSVRDLYFNKAYL
jgi:hypothetical protein